MEIREEFIEAAIWHGSLDRAETILAAHPDLAGHDIHIAAILGDEAAVRRFLVENPAGVHAKSGPHGGDSLNYLGLSKYLRLQPERTPAFLATATALLDAGADPNTGFWTTGRHPERETVLYGAAGVAHHPELTRLLLQRGADPTDEEVVYHSPEGHDSRAMQLVVQTGRLKPEDLRLMLVRKLDWHDAAGARWLLEHGARLKEGLETRWPEPLHHALERDNSIEILTLLLDHGADPTAAVEGVSGVGRAARKGRGDFLAELGRRGISLSLSGMDQLLAACALDDAEQIRALREREPELARRLAENGGRYLGDFASTCNSSGVRRLLDLGVPPDAAHPGDGYFGIPPGSTALQIAAWRICVPTLKLLLERGAEVNQKDGRGMTPLALAVRANVDSYWTEYRTPEAVAALLNAGAAIEGVSYPSGYADVDELLRARAG